MISDPYIEVINKTKSLHLDEKLVEESIDKFLKDGADKTWLFLIHEKKMPENKASKLMEEIKKEFRATYFANALWIGVIMIIALTLMIVFFVETDITNIWIYPTTALFLRCLYSVIKNLAKGLSIK